VEEIKLAIINRLADYNADVTIYDERIQQGFQEPCFFVLLVDGSQQRGINRRIRAALFDVHYFPPADASPREACERMAASLYEALEFVERDAGKYRAVSMKHQVVDGVLHFFVSFSVHMMLEKPVTHALQTVELEVHTK